MIVVRARCAGLCFGVRRASDMVERLIADGKAPLFTIGPLMHNPQEVERLARAGVLARERIEDCRGARTVVRTHGIGRQLVARAAELGVELVDATCPFVLAPRRRLVEIGQTGRLVFLVGDAQHPEIQAQRSYASGPLEVVQSASEVPDLPRSTPVGVVAQTTLARDAFEAVTARILQCFEDVLVFDTICQDTDGRQAEGQRLAAEVDAMVVVGGRNSANTTRLADLCRRVQPNTVRIETAEELEGLPPLSGPRVGLTSGASTPDWIIDQVEAWLRRRG